MTRETLAAALMVWLIGAVVGWCAGWAARGEQNRGWHQGAVRQLAATHADLDELHAELAGVLEDLDDARAAHYPAQRGPAAPAVVHVHVAAPGPWPAQRLVTTDTTRCLDAMPVLPADEVP